MLAIYIVLAPSTILHILHVTEQDVAQGEKAFCVFNILTAEKKNDRLEG